MQWLRRSFIAGFFVTVPLVISVAALVWIFGIIDGFTPPARVLAGRSRIRARPLITRSWAGVGTCDQRHRTPLVARARLADRVPVFRRLCSCPTTVVAFSARQRDGFTRSLCRDPRRVMVSGSSQRVHVDRGRGRNPGVGVLTHHSPVPRDGRSIRASTVLFPLRHVEEAFAFFHGGMSRPIASRARQRYTVRAVRRREGPSRIVILSQREEQSGDDRVVKRCAVTVACAACGS